MHALLLLACLALQDKTEPVPFTVLVKGGTYGLPKPEEKVLTTEKEWAEVWERAESWRVPKRKLPDVDFTKDVVVVVAFGQQPTPGYAIEVTRIEKTAKEIRISVRRTVPPNDAALPQIITHPYVVVKTAKPDRAVVFVVEKN